MLDDRQRENVEHWVRQTFRDHVRTLEITQLEEEPRGYVIVYRSDTDVRVCSLSINGRVRWDRTVSARAPR